MLIAPLQSSIDFSFVPPKPKIEVKLDNSNKSVLGPSKCLKRVILFLDYYNIT